MDGKNDLAGPFTENWGIEAETLTIRIKHALLHWSLPLLLACWILPNTQQIMRKFQPAINFIEDPRRSLFYRMETQPHLVAGGSGHGGLMLVQYDRYQRISLFSILIYVS